MHFGLFDKMGGPILLGYGCDVRCFSHSNVFEQKCY
jgi:hypothetical protein